MSVVINAQWPRLKVHSYRNKKLRKDYNVKLLYNYNNKKTDTKELFDCNETSYAKIFRPSSTSGLNLLPGEWIARTPVHQKCAFSRCIWGTILNVMVKFSAAFRLPISYIGRNNASPKYIFTKQTNVRNWKRLGVDRTEKGWWHESNSRSTFVSKRWNDKTMLIRVSKQWQISGSGPA